MRVLGDRVLDEHEGKAVLAGAGIRVPEGRACDDREQAGQALAELGGPVVVKILDASVTHKSDHGGVHPGIRTPEDLSEALDALDALAARLGVRPRYLVERQAPPGPELIVGGLRDRAFGPVLLLALGGVGVELAPEPALRLAPITRADAEEMIGELPAPLLAGYRGAPPLDVPAVTDVLLAAASILTTHPDLAELDINPLRLTPEGPIALDALLAGGHPTDPRQTPGNPGGSPTAPAPPGGDTPRPTPGGTPTDFTEPDPLRPTSEDPGGRQFPSKGQR